MKKLVHFKIDKFGREIPKELDRVREQITKERNCEFYTVPEGVFDVPFQIEEVKICDPREFIKLGGEIYECNAELADKVTQIYDDLKFWKEEAPELGIWSGSEIQRNIKERENILQKTLERYASSCKRVSKNELEKELNKFYALEIEDYEGCSIEINTEPFLPEFLLCAKPDSEADRYLKETPYSKRDKVYNLIGKMKHIQI